MGFRIYPLDSGIIKSKIKPSKTGDYFFLTLVAQKKQALLNLVLLRLQEWAKARIK